MKLTQKELRILIRCTTIACQQTQIGEEYHEIVSIHRKIKEAFVANELSKRGKEASEAATKLRNKFIDEAKR